MVYSAPKEVVAMKACQPIQQSRGQLLVLLELDIMLYTEGSEPASSVAEYVLNARRCKFRHPADCEYNNEDVSIACHLTNDIVHQLLETYEVVSNLVSAMITTRKVLHGCHLSHRSCCDHREDPCCDVNVGQTLSIGERRTSSYRFRSAYSSAAIELANARCAGW